MQNGRRGGRREGKTNIVARVIAKTTTARHQSSEFAAQPSFGLRLSTCVYNGFFVIYLTNIRTELERNVTFYVHIQPRFFSLNIFYLNPYIPFTNSSANISHVEFFPSTFSCNFQPSSWSALCVRSRKLEFPREESIYLRSAKGRDIRYLFFFLNTRNVQKLFL